MENMLFGLNITLIGMGLVFALLALLWLVLTLIGRIDNLSFPKAREGASPLEESGVPGSQLEPGLLAAVAVAITVHRASRNKSPETPLRTVVQGNRPPQPSPWASVDRVYYGFRRKG